MADSIFPTDYTYKNTVVSTDEILIADSQSAYFPKKVKVQTLGISWYPYTITVWFTQGDYVCDWTDDDVQIQQALDQADSSFLANWWKVSVVLENWTYQINNTLKIYSRTSIKWQWEGTTLKAWPSLVWRIIDFKHRKSSSDQPNYWQIIEDLHFDWNTINPIAMITDCRNAIVRNCKFEYFYWNAIEIIWNQWWWYTIQPRITWNVFDFWNIVNWTSIFVWAWSFDWLVQANDMGRANKWLVISSWWNTKFTILNNWAWWNIDCWYQFYDCHQMKVIGNTAEQNFWHWMLVQTSSDIVFSSNITNDSSFVDLTNQFWYWINYWSWNTYSNIVFDSTTQSSLVWHQSNSTLSNQAKYWIHVTSSSSINWICIESHNNQTQNILIDWWSTFTYTY